MYKQHFPVAEQQQDLLTADFSMLEFQIYSVLPPANLSILKFCVFVPVLYLFTTGFLVIKFLPPRFLYCGSPSIHVILSLTVR